jgi:hypothetical protein
MSNGMNVQSVFGFFSEADAVVSDTKAQVAGISLKLFHVAFPRLCKPMERGENAHGDFSVQAPYIDSGRLGPNDLSHV